MGPQTNEKRSADAGRRWKRGFRALTDVADFGLERISCGSLRNSVQTGEGAHGIVVEPSSRHAYVTNMCGDDVVVLDLKALKVVARIPVGAKPNGVSFSTVTVSDRPATKIELPLNHEGGAEMTH